MKLGPPSCFHLMHYLELQKGMEIWQLGSSNCYRHAIWFLDLEEPQMAVLCRLALEQVGVKHPVQPPHLQATTQMPPRVTGSRGAGGNNTGANTPP